MEPIKKKYREFCKTKPRKKADFFGRELVYDEIHKKEREWKKDTYRRMERICEALRIPYDVLNAVPILQMIGRNSVVVENYKKIVQYETPCIRILTGIGILRIEGEHLRIAFYTKEECKIVGNIMMISYEGMKTKR